MAAALAYLKKIYGGDYKIFELIKNQRVFEAMYRFSAKSSKVFNTAKKDTADIRREKAKMPALKWE